MVPPAPAEHNRDLIEDGLVLLTLQSNAIMLDPDEVRSLPLGMDLYEAYAAYWQDISEGSLELVLHNINFAILDNAFGVYLWHFPF